MTAVIYTGTPSSSQNLVPSNVNTLEELLVWALCLFYNLHGARDIYLVEGQIPVKMCTQNIFNGADNKQYVAYTTYLPINSAWQSDRSKKFWEWAQEITTAVGPSTFNEN